MLRAQAVEQALDRGRQAFVCGNLGYPACVAARGGDLEQGQDGDGRRLVLVGNVGVVAGGCEACGLALGPRQIVGP